MSYLAETLINEMHIMSYLLFKDLPRYNLHNLLVYLRISLSRYSYILRDFHTDFLIEAILIKRVSVLNR